MSETTISYPYQRPAITTDCVIFGFDGLALKLLLLKREKEPFEKIWALPGGFVQIDETTEDSARRVLLEKTGLKNPFIEQLYTFSELNRDPRERVISVSYFALLNMADFVSSPGRDTLETAWTDVTALPKLAFDHETIVKVAVERLQNKVRYQPLGFELLDKKFTLSQLQQLYEAILQTNLDKRNFRKKILGTGLLKQLDQKEQNVARKAAYYYSFNKKSYQALSQKGFHFEI